MKKKIKKGWKEFAAELEKDVEYLKSSECWKDDYLALYGFCWCRWHLNMGKSEIVSELERMLGEKEAKDRHGTISVKVRDDKICLVLRSKSEKWWQKVICSRLCDGGGITITKDLNISFDIELTEEEKELRKNAFVAANKLQTPK